MSIRKLLIANRGEIASRIIRTARAMDIATVAVFSDPDAGLPFVTGADEAVRLPGSAPADTYLRGEALIAAAAATGADAVHPGYGFLSENAGFARACAAAGLTFVGPSPEAIEAMGSKTAAKELMAAAGVPVLPGAVFDDPAFGDGAEPDPAELRKAGEDIGFPVLVKAAYGGGGRGMRIVASPDDIAGAVSSARREAASAFGNGTVFLERFVESPRHIEVQILGDQAGTVVHLFERECSIQRRYQKIIEEAPSPAVDDGLRAELCRAAVAAGQAIGYVGRRDRRVRAGLVGALLLPRGQHPAAGRAPGHRADHRTGPGPAAAGDRGRPAAAGARHRSGQLGDGLHRPRDRGPALRRGCAGRLPARERRPAHVRDRSL